jgi:hypothetical protein
MTTNQERQYNEYLLLQSMYGEEIYRKDPNEEHTYLFTPTCPYPMYALTLRIHLPSTYPSDTMPIAEIQSHYDTLSQGEKDKLLEELYALYVPDEEVLYSWTCHLTNYITDQCDQIQAKMETAVSSQQASPPPPPSDIIQTLDWDPNQIYHGEAIIDRKSVFVAHLAQVHSVEDVKAVRATLLSDRKIARATHNIMAYRIILNNGVVLQDCDDDGETQAGSRLLHLLQIVDAQNVVVVVSRWYGGIQLGPDRFKHINNAARSLLETHGYIRDKSTHHKKR